MNIPFSPPDIQESDIEAVVSVLKSGWITSGPVGEEFRHALTKFCNSADTILVNSATAALESALRILGIGPGDEVIVPAYTYSASASVIDHVGAKIIMADVAENSFFVAPETWESYITKKTKAIIPVDLGGVMADLEPIYTAIETKRNIYQPNNPIQEQLGRVAIIVDGAHSLGAELRGKKAGEAGDFTAFSFHAVKNLTTAEGGALTWRTDNGLDSNDIYQSLRLLILHGQTKSALEKTNAAAWEYDIVSPAYKMNLADIMAALGLSQLKRYPQTIARRHEIVNHYQEVLAETPVDWLTHEGTDFYSSAHLFLLRINGATEAQRNTFIEEMAAAGVSCNVHYKPLPLLTAYQNLGFNISDYPNALAQYQNEVTLPLHTCLTNEQMEYVAQQTKENLLKLKQNSR